MAHTTIALDQEAPLKGILYLVVGLSLFSIQDVVIKLLSGAYPAHEIVFIRAIVSLLPILLIARLEGGWHLLRTRRPGLHVLRGLASFAAYTTYYLALTALPLADTVTLFYASPIFVTALAVMILGEQVGLRRWLAMLAGFAGVVVVTRPFGGAPEPAMLLAVASALAYSISILITRRLAKTEAASSLAFYAMITFLAASTIAGLVLGDGRFADADHPSAAFLLRAWIWPSSEDLALMVTIGLIAGVGFYCLSQAYRLASASLVAPFEYSSLPWAILWGYLVWSDLPGPATVFGLALIVGSGLYIIHREGVRGRRLVRGRALR